MMKRRTFVKGLAFGALLSGRFGGKGGAASTEEPVGGMPERQFAWNHVLRTDQYGNPQLPAHHALALLRLNKAPSMAAARRMEQVLSRMERIVPRGPDGILFVVGWGPAYFREILGVPESEIPLPDLKPLSSFETPVLDNYHACFHLAGDNQERLEALLAALFKGNTAVHGEQTDLDLRPILHLAELRTGFSGAPFPFQNQDVSGLPSSRPLSLQSPLFMGFQSGFKGNQASEHEITIKEGYFRGGTTMHVSRIRLRLNDWYEHLNQEERVARMFSPFLTPSQVESFRDNPPVDPERLNEAVKTRGVAGHAQKSAQARRKGRPIILRRDFNTADGGSAGLHFVALQRSIDDFITVRRAMNGDGLTYENPAVGPRINNGILEFMFVLNRANYIVPPRRHRSFPWLEKVKT
jgi:hypothetical protein